MGENLRKGLNLFGTCLTFALAIRAMSDVPCYTTSVFYLDTRCSIDSSTQPPFFDLAKTTTIYNAQLIAPRHIRDSPVDIWRNPKVPVFESLDKMVNSEGWIAVPSRGARYSSLMGFQVLGVPAAGQTKFTGVYSYFDF